LKQRPYLRLLHQRLLRGASSCPRLVRALSTRHRRPLQERHLSVGARSSSGHGLRLLARRGHVLPRRFLALAAPCILLAPSLVALEAPAVRLAVQALLRVVLGPALVLVLALALVRELLVARLA
jgi:hypothetical protein